MKNYSSEFINVMFERGFLKDCTDFDKLDKKLLEKNIVAYIGYDATAKSLHVGHLVNIMMLRWFQKCGHKPITLMGGGTTKIGDPSFRSKERPLLEEKQIDDNINNIKGVFSKYLQYNNEKNGALILNNADWLNKLNYITFLREIGKHFSVNRMINFESVKARLKKDESLSFLEFNYMILQAYDFMKLNENYNCILQMGGSDQWGNIVNGIELARRINNKNIFGLTSPLLANSSGQKMGKSSEGTVWLNSDLTSPFDFWQFWRNVDDKDVYRFFLLFTELSIKECEEIKDLKGSDINEAKNLLAFEITKLCHGEKEAIISQNTAKQIYEKKEIGKDLPVKNILISSLNENYRISNLFVECGLVKSGKEAKRLISEGGARINDEVIDNVSFIKSRHSHSKVVRLSSGKKKHIIVKFI